MNAALVSFGCIMLAFVGLPGAIVASIIIALVTLQKGYKSGALVLAFVALPAVGFLLHKEMSPFDITFLQCVFVWALAGLLRKFQSWRLVFEVMVVIGIVLIAVFHLLVPDAAQFWTQIITNFITKLNVEANANINMAEVTKAIAPFVTYLSGILLFTLLSLVFVELLLARRWDMRVRGNAEGYSREFTHIQMGMLNIVLLVLAGVGALFHSDMARDCLFVVVLPFMYSGLSYVHYLVKRNRQLIYLLVILYVGLFLTYTCLEVVLLLALVGFVDSLCDFRKRLAF
jgi:hypothetical protein